MCQCSCGIFVNGSASLYSWSYTQGLEVIAFSLDTNLNYGPIYSNNILEPKVILLFIILCIQEEQKVRKPEVSGTNRGSSKTLAAIQQV